MTDEKTLLELRNLEIEVDTPRGPIRPVSGISLSIPKGKTLALRKIDDRAFRHAAAARERPDSIRHGYALG